MMFLFSKEKLIRIFIYYMGIDISFFTDYQFVVIGLLTSIVIILSSWFTINLFYKIYLRLIHK